MIGLNSVPRDWVPDSCEASEEETGSYPLNDSMPQLVSSEMREIYFVASILVELSKVHDKLSLCISGIQNVASKSSTVNAPRFDMP